MRVQFAALVAALDVDLGKVTNAGDLHIVRSADKVHTLERAGWHRPGTAARLGAPRNLVALSVTNGANRGRRPEAKVVGIVDPGCLALARLRRTGATVVVTKLAILGCRGNCQREVGGKGRRTRCQQKLGRTRGAEALTLVRHVADVPDLIRVRAAAVPDLSGVAIVHAPVGEVEALELNMVRTGRS